MIDTQTVIVFITGVISFLTMLVVTIIGWILNRSLNSLDRAHIRIDDVEREVTAIERCLRKEFVSEVNCKSRSRKDAC